jgi:hypothetical protein
MQAKESSLRTAAMTRSSSHEDCATEKNYVENAIEHCEEKF